MALTINPKITTHDIVADSSAKNDVLVSLLNQVAKLDAARRPALPPMTCRWYVVSHNLGQKGHLEMGFGEQAVYGLKARILGDLPADIVATKHILLQELVVDIMTHGLASYRGQPAHPFTTPEWTAVETLV